MTAPDLDALERAAQEATPGPWRVAPKFPRVVLSDTWDHVAEAALPQVGGWELASDNAAYIAAANPAAILSLIAEVREGRRLAAINRLRPESEWHETYGPVLWWIFPLQEEPWIGTPYCDDWPGYHTHWSEIPEPPEPWPVSTATAQVTE